MTYEFKLPHPNPYLMNTTPSSSNFMKYLFFTELNGIQNARAMFLAAGYNEVFSYPKNTAFPKISFMSKSLTRLNVDTLCQGLEGISGLPFMISIIHDDATTNPNLEQLLLTDIKQHLLLPQPQEIQYPLLQVAFDLLSNERAYEIASQIPASPHVILEAGTPLIKIEGLSSIRILKEARPGSFVVADLKTLDTGALEVNVAVNAGADAIAVSGLADTSTLNMAVKAALDKNKMIIIDMLNVKDPLNVLRALDTLPTTVLLHRGIDMETQQQAHRWDLIREIKTVFPTVKVAIAGGITLTDVSKAVNNNVDILIVGRAITQATDISHAVTEFVKRLTA